MNIPVTHTLTQETVRVRIEIVYVEEDPIVVSTHLVQTLIEIQNVLLPLFIGSEIGVLWVLRSIMSFNGRYYVINADVPQTQPRYGYISPDRIRITVNNSLDD